MSARTLSGKQEERRYIDSAITHLDDPIGGCYEVLTTSSNGFSAYALGGAGLVKGTPWLHVTVEVRVVVILLRYTLLGEPSLVFIQDGEGSRT